MLIRAARPEEAAILSELANAAAPSLPAVRG